MGKYRKYILVSLFLVVITGGVLIYEKASWTRQYKKYAELHVRHEGFDRGKHRANIYYSRKRQMLEGVINSNIQVLDASKKPKPRAAQTKKINKTTRSINNNNHSVFAGVFKITAYTAGFESTGKTKNSRGYGITATGSRVKEGRTVAADFKLLPPGTRITIEGLSDIYIVEDRGGGIKGKKLDLYIESYKAAIKWGVKRLKVRIVK